MVTVVGATTAAWLLGLVGLGFIGLVIFAARLVLGLAELTDVWLDRSIVFAEGVNSGLTGRYIECLVLGAWCLVGAGLVVAWLVVGAPLSLLCVESKTEEVRLQKKKVSYMLERIQKSGCHGSQGDTAMRRVIQPSARRSSGMKIS
ncbi:hypothetical protein B0H66DRAFT_531195 [Apodospora peruviana]|uniref:Uncharacterized protein n=1 Tax=Apodospora peruviana TaxID=516989 RepID=A0AAE0ICN1_9PEZI|nr:hypothetical protein B0H66DRAFT_531195 [Apodospora peruviana]